MSKIKDTLLSLFIEFSKIKEISYFHNILFQIVTKIPKKTCTVMTQKNLKILNRKFKNSRNSDTCLLIDLLDNKFFLCYIDDFKKSKIKFLHVPLSLD